jgi:hypothetical protein
MGRIRNPSTFTLWHCSFKTILLMSMVNPTEYIRGRVEIGLSVSALSAGAYTTTLYVMVNTVKSCGSAPPSPHQAGLIFPSWWHVRQKVAIATLCVLCGQRNPSFLCLLFFCLACSQKVEFEDKCLLLTLRKLDFEKLWILARRGGERYTVYKHPPPPLLLN